MKTINVKDLNLDNTGKNLITNNIKKIIEDNYNEELAIIFPNGIYKLSTYKEDLRPDVKLINVTKGVN